MITGDRRRSGRPSIDEAELLGDAILAAAHTVFVTRGFEGASMEAIARAAGITKRTLYRRAATKELLFAAVIDRQERHAGAPRLREIGAGNLEQRLVEAADVVLAWFLDPDALGLYRVIIAEVPRQPMLSTATIQPFSRAADAIVEILGADDPRPTDDLHFGATTFLRLVTAEPLDLALQGVEPVGYDAAKRARTRRAVAFFVAGWRASRGDR